MAIRCGQTNRTAVNALDCNRWNSGPFKAFAADMITKVVGQKVSAANRTPARWLPEFTTIGKLDPLPE